MKTFLIGLLILGHALAADHIENFYVVDSGLFIEGGYGTLDGQIVYDNSANSDLDFSSFRYNVLGQYAFSRLVNVGVELAYNRGPSYEGMEDYRLFLRGQKSIFFYGVNFLYSPEKEKDESAFTGGNHFAFQGGLFENGFGAKFTLSPQYDVAVKNGKDKKSSKEVILEAFYEKKLKDHILGAGLGQYQIDSNKELASPKTPRTFFCMDTLPWIMANLLFSQASSITRPLSRPRFSMK